MQAISGLTDACMISSRMRDNMPSNTDSREVHMCMHAPLYACTYMHAHRQIACNSCIYLMHVQLHACTSKHECTSENLNLCVHCMQISCMHTYRPHACALCRLHACTSACGHARVQTSSRPSRRLTVRSMGDEVSSCLWGTTCSASFSRA